MTRAHPSRFLRVIRLEMTQISSSPISMTAQYVHSKYNGLQPRSPLQYYLYSFLFDCCNVPRAVNETVTSSVTACSRGCGLEGGGDGGGSIPCAVAVRATNYLRIQQILGAVGSLREAAHQLGTSVTDTGNQVRTTLTLATRLDHPLTPWHTQHYSWTDRARPALTSSKSWGTHSDRNRRAAPTIIGALGGRRHFRPPGTCNVTTVQATITPDAGTHSTKNYSALKDLRGRAPDLGSHPGTR